MTPPIPPWLLDLVKKYGLAAAKQLLKLLRPQLDKLTNRQRAISQARSTTDGRFASAHLEGGLRFVVFAGHRPIDAHPPVEGDLPSLLADFDMGQLQDPNDLTVIRSKRRARVGIGAIGHRVPRRKPKLDAAGAPLRETASGGAEEFHKLTDGLPALLDKLTRSPAAKVGDHEQIPAAPGVYLFSDGPNYMYVGQTRNLRRRLRDHTSASSRENQASFAFRLAEEAAEAQALAVAGTRKQRASDEQFAALFTEARARVADMDVRFIELADPIERTLFEVFVARALGLDQYNDFETH